MYRKISLVSLLLITTACGTFVTPTAKPSPTVAATVALPTFTPSPIPPTATPIFTATALKPTATSTITPTSTRTRAPVTATTRPAATATQPPTPRGSIAYRVTRDGVDRMFIVNLESGTSTPLFDVGPSMDFVESTNAHFAEFSPDVSKLAYIFAGQLNQPNVLTIFDLRSGSKAPIFSSDSNGGGLSSPTWSPDGKQVAVIRMSPNQRVWGIHVINADATGTPNTLRLTDQGEQYRGGISWSRTGVLTLAMNTTGASDVYRLFIDGSGLHNFTNHPADDSTPVWGPDGKHIAFVSTRDGRSQIYVMNADGTGTRRVSNSPFADFSPAWAPDGNWLAFTSIRENSTDVYIMDLQGSNVRRITTGGGDHPIWAR